MNPKIDVSKVVVSITEKFSTIQNTLNSSRSNAMDIFTHTTREIEKTIGDKARREREYREKHIAILEEQLKDSKEYSKRQSKRQTKFLIIAIVSLIIAIVSAIFSCLSFVVPYLSRYHNINQKSNYSASAVNLNLPKIDEGFLLFLFE